MDNQLQIFNHPEFGGVRVIGDYENPRFCLSDVCKILELPQVAKVVQRLGKGVLTRHPLQTAGGMQEVYFVNEDGLYDVILDSRKPEAKRFRKWVTSEVLPSIRKHGVYSVNGELSDTEKIKILIELSQITDTAALRDSLVAKAAYIATGETDYFSTAPLRKPRKHICTYDPYKAKAFILQWIDANKEHFTQSIYEDAPAAPEYGVFRNDCLHIYANPVFSQTLKSAGYRDFRTLLHDLATISFVLPEITSEGKRRILYWLHRNRISLKKIPTVCINLDNPAPLLLK